jgi:hypothetical protein
VEPEIKAELEVKQDPEVWKEGFRASEAGRRPGRCPYSAGSIEAWSWFSGYIEAERRKSREEGQA